MYSTYLDNLLVVVTCAAGPLQPFIDSLSKRYGGDAYSMIYIMCHIELVTLGHHMCQRATGKPLTVLLVHIAYQHITYILVCVDSLTNVYTYTLRHTMRMLHYVV